MMKRALFVLLLLLPIGASFAGSIESIIARRASLGGSAVSGSNITSSIWTTDETVEVACSSLGSPTGMLYVASATAYDSLGASPTATVTGCGLTWTELQVQITGVRRFMSLSRGVGSFSSVGDLVITLNDDGENSYQETLYSINDISNYNGGDPDDAPVSEDTTGTGNDLPDVGTPGTGDAVFSLHVDEDASDGITLTAGITQLSKYETGSNVRALIVGFDDDPADETPGVTSNTSGSIGGIAVIINVAP